MTNLKKKEKINLQNILPYPSSWCGDIEKRDQKSRLL